MFLNTNLLPYVLLVIALFFSMLIYFYIGRRYNIVDKPNQRSSHSIVTIRGGGIIFPIAIILYSLFFHQVSNILIVSILAISIISFVDDVLTIGVRLRILVHIFSTTALIYILGGFQFWPSLLIPLTYVIIIGSVNAYNFMDGINGITGLYSLVTFCFLLYINTHLSFTDPDFILMGALSCLVFLFFNFRKRAKCFAGDVGSVTMAFWIISLIAMLVNTTGDMKYIFFLSVYGVDSILTIVFRLWRKENIFLPHRLHFYQILANDAKIPQLHVSTLYAVIQIFINLIVIYSGLPWPLLLLLLNIPLCMIYIILKPRLMRV